MDLQKLTQEFLVDNQSTPARTGQLIEKLLPYCVVHRDGTVEFRTGNLPSKAQVKLVLCARLVASQLPSSDINAEVSTDEIAHDTGLPKNQAYARAKECVDERFAERTGRGSYKARLHKVDGFLATLSEP